MTGDDRPSRFPAAWRPAHRYGQADSVACQDCRDGAWCWQAAVVTSTGDGRLVVWAPDGWIWESTDGGESWRLPAPRPVPPPPLPKLWAPDG